MPNADDRLTAASEESGAALGTSRRATARPRADRRWPLVLGLHVAWTFPMRRKAPPEHDLDSRGQQRDGVDGIVAPVPTYDFPADHPLRTHQHVRGDRRHVFEPGRD